MIDRMARYADGQRLGHRFAMRMNSSSTALAHKRRENADTAQPQRLTKGRVDMNHRIVADAEAGEPDGEIVSVG